MKAGPEQRARPTADYLQGHPKEAVILFAVELCSLTIQRDDLSLPNLVASGLFGDGAAAVLMVGDDHPRAQSGMPRVIDSQSQFFPETEHIMGWDVTNSGFKVLLSADIASLAQAEVRPSMEAFLSRHDLTIADITVGCAPGRTQGDPGAGRRSGPLRRGPDTELGDSG
jgi:alkylresorcinol/alkylpyrone synthase